MRAVVLLGPPGAGKGTVAERLSAELGHLHLSTGDVLRDEVARGTPLGRRAQGYMERGELVPDEVILAMVRERVEEGEVVLFDGFPRTLAQAEGLAAIAPVERALYLQLPKEEVVRRLSARRVCKNCGANYNLITQPPAVPGRCDRCGGELQSRRDDAPEVIARRFEVFLSESAPLINYYERQGVLRRVDAARPPAEVFAQVLSALRP